MKFKITVRNKGEKDTWTEAYDIVTVETQEQAKEMGETFVAYFNSGLRPGEKEREFVSAEITGPSDPETDPDEWGEEEEE